MNKTPPRPTQLDDKSRLKAAQILDARINEYDMRKQFGKTKRQIIDDLVAHLKPRQDGYALAKALEAECGWKITTFGVEVLDTGTFAQAEAIRLAQEKWVKKYNITPPLPVGSRVWFPWVNGSRIAGEIIAMAQAHPACYVIHPYAEFDIDHNPVVYFEAVTLEMEPMQ